MAKMMYFVAGLQAGQSPTQPDNVPWPQHLLGEHSRAGATSGWQLHVVTRPPTHTGSVGLMYYIVAEKMSFDNSTANSSSVDWLGGRYPQYIPCQQLGSA